MMLKRRDLLQAAGIAALGAATLKNDALAAGDVAISDTPPGASVPKVGITWVGAATMLIRFGDLTILTDPAFGETFQMGDPNDAEDHETIRTHRRLTPSVKVDLHAVDLVLLSHAHIDHFDQQAENDLDRSLRMLLPVADEKAVVAKGFDRIDPMSWGETRQFDAGPGQVSVTAVPAHHSMDPTIAGALGIGNGYWIEFGRPGRTWTMYWTGDTMPTADVVEAVRSLGRPDLMVPHIGKVGAEGPFGQISMGAEDVVALAAALQPHHVLPIHHSTYAFYREPVETLIQSSRGRQFQLDVIRAGGTMHYWSR